MQKIIVLCKVVDNFGDIGVVYRLCRALNEAALSTKKQIKIHLVTNDLKTFSKMQNKVDGSKNHQQMLEMEIFDWNDFECCHNFFSKNYCETVLQCFQCERPEWLEKILFEDEATKNRKVKIINVEYLTAESWADDFHLLKSATRNINVKKINFMPGFTPKTGSLILDKNFMNCCASKKFALSIIKNQNLKTILNDDEIFKIIVFSYPHNFEFLFNALKKFSECSSKKICVLIAEGAGKKSFMKFADKKSGFKIFELPYLEQTEWDALLTLADFSFIRGEDSFSRACLCGIPFIWNIYPQDEEFHLVKLDAFLKILDVEQINKFSFLYNRNFEKPLGTEAAEILCKNNYDDFLNDENDAQKILEDEIFKILCSAKMLSKKFLNFSEKLILNGNLAEKLLEQF